MLSEVQEDTRAWLTATFYGKDGEAVLPTSAAYKVYCMTTQTLIRDTTALVPATEIEIELDETDNAIQDAANKREKRKVCVISEYGVGDDREDNYYYNVVQRSGCGG